MWLQPLERPERPVSLRELEEVVVRGFPKEHLLTEVRKLRIVALKQIFLGQSSFTKKQCFRLLYTVQHKSLPLICTVGTNGHVHVAWICVGLKPLANDTITTAMMRSSNS